MNGLFPLLVADAQTSNAEHFAPVESDDDHLAAIHEPLEMIHLNCDEGDSDSAKLINLAHVVAAAQRYSHELRSRLSAADVKRLCEEVGT